MGLADIIRAGIATADAATKDLQPTVQIEPWIADDAFGRATYAAAVPYQAIVEKINRRMTTPNGVDAVVKYYIAIIGPVAPNGASGRREPVDQRDRITCPDGDTGPIVDYRGLFDSGTDAPYLSEIWLG